MNVLLFSLLSIVLSVGSMPLIIKICAKKGLYDYADERKIHSGNIPRLGGVGIFIAFVLSAFLYLYFTESIELASSIPILIAGLIIFLFAIIDDILNLKAIIKLIVQLIAVSIVTIHGYRFTQIFNWVIPAPLSFFITFCWILGVINAYNLIDGLDGLCGTLSITTVCTLGIIYAMCGNYECGLCFILAGAIFGFLCFNWPPAKIFMGDSGSQFLGFMIATVPLYTADKTFEYNKLLVMIILTAIPVFDTIAAIWRRLRDKKPIMSADKAHLHHKLLNIGYSKKTALYFIAFIQTLACFLVIVAYKLGSEKGTAILLEVAALLILFFSFIHFSNRKARIAQKDTKTE